MKCNSCGKEMPDEVLICPSCQTSYTVCNKCGKKYESKLSECPQCEGSDNQEDAEIVFNTQKSRSINVPTGSVSDKNTTDLTELDPVKKRQPGKIRGAISFFSGLLALIAGVLCILKGLFILPGFPFPVLFQDSFLTSLIIFSAAAGLMALICIICFIFTSFHTGLSKAGLTFSIFALICTAAGATLFFLMPPDKAAVSGNTSAAIQDGSPADGFENLSSISKRKIRLGESITVTGSASGGTAPYSFSYQYRKSGAGEWKKLGDELSAEFKPHTKGSYDIRMFASDADGRSSVVTQSLTVTDKNGSAELNNTSYLVQDTVKSGEQVFIHGSAEGGTPPYTFSCQYKRSFEASWNELYFNSDDVATLKPSAPGHFNIRVYVKDSSDQVEVKSLNLKAE